MHFHAAFAVLAAILTVVAVFAVKRGTEWGLAGASDATLNSLIALGLLLAVLAMGWTYLLRPRLVKRRQQRE